ncbi:heavy-metal-associated domain-containing protein, partial [Umezakia ovalisporum]|uniref:heavy-metal-associated domain-containing protein n=1 Tax=Umezakia ovalisporum TaxID=75695 RepID=UPI0039C60146
MATLFVQAQNKPEKTSFKVFGNCGMCKSRIEEALDMKGVKSAEWNIQTKQLDIVYVPSKVSLEQIHAAIAGVGHDTELKKAEEKVYKELPHCCL